MGYRMEIYPEGKEDKQVGNDHKLYGYAAYDEVSSSFEYLFLKGLSKTEEFEDYLEFELEYDSASRYAYDIFCCIGASPDITLSEHDFEEFTELYLSDFERHFPDSKEDLQRVADYMHKMCEVPGNKILQWG